MTTAKLADGSVASIKIAAGAVGAAAANSQQVQRRVTGTCAVGSSIRVINEDGTVVCELDDNSGGTVTSVGTGAGLTGGPITTTGTISIADDGVTSAKLAAGAVTATKLAADSVTSAKILDGTITAADIGSGQVVKSINTLKDDVTLAAGANVTITPSGSTLTIAATGGIGGSGIADRIAKFTAPNTIGNSAIFETGGSVGIGTTNPEARLHVRNGTIVVGPFADTFADGNLDGVVTVSGGNGQLILVRRQLTSWPITPVAGDDFRLYNGEGVLRFFTPVNGDMVVLTSVGNVGIGTTTPTSRLHVIGDITATGAKNFQIDHPQEPDKKLLVHSALEGPEVGVYYRGEAQLQNGEVEIALPSYFEALTRKDNRTVQLTPINGWAPLYVVDSVQDGRFKVRTADGGNQTQRFYWEVKAVRADVLSLVVEREKVVENMKVAENFKP